MVFVFVFGDSMISVLSVACGYTSEFVSSCVSRFSPISTCHKTFTKSGFFGTSFKVQATRWLVHFEWLV